MSDTDDTDDLLLIPPDLFVVDSELEDTAVPYYSVVNSLITLVSNLETRVNSIETTDSLSSLLDSPNNYKFMSNTRRSLSSEELGKYNVDSTQSTPQKPRTVFKLNSLPNTPSSPKFNPRHRNVMQNEETKKSKMFTDINTFISNVNSLKQMTAVRNLEHDFLKPQDYDNDILYRLDNELHAEFSRRGFDLKKAAAKPEQFTSNRMPLYNDQLPPNVNDSISSDQTTDSNSQSQSTVYRNSNNIGKSSSYDYEGLSKSVRSFKDTTSNLKLLSLHELWNDSQNSRSTSSSFQQKLEEEKIKRQHCELTIQTLQSRLLEMQEKLAVAVEVDKSKDDAIMKFHDAWEQISERIQSLTAERNLLEEDCKVLQAKNVSDLAEAAKKIAFYEQEASKALNIAHTSQDKMGSLEYTNRDLLTKMKDMQSTIENLTVALQKETEKCKKLADMLLEKDLDHSKTKSCLENARKEIAESKKAVDLCQAEFIMMKTQYTQLELQMNSDKDRIVELEGVKRKQQEEIEVLKKHEKTLRDDCKKQKEQNEQNKMELRNFYQDQVELVVKDKLKEFQTQLDQAETSLQEELKKRETTIIKSAALHIQQLSEKHHLEIQLLEEKHKEESRLFQIKLSQSQRHIEDLQLRFMHQKEYKANIAEQLQKVMEAQWSEAVRILNSGRSPSMPQDQNYAYEQLNSLKSQSYSNLEELLSVTDRKLQQKFAKEKFESASSTAGEFGEKIEDNIEETPVSSRQLRSREQIENDLQRLVALLSQKSKIATDLLAEPNFKSQDDKTAKPSGSYKKQKPPWK